MDQPSARSRVLCIETQPTEVTCNAAAKVGAGYRRPRNSSCVWQAVGRRPGCSLCSTSATAWKAFGRRWQGKEQGTQMGRDSRSQRDTVQQPAPGSPGMPRALAGCPGRHCLCSSACADRQTMNPAHGTPSGDPPAEPAPPSCSCCCFPCNFKAQHRPMLDSSGSEHLPNHTTLTLHHQSSSATSLLP